MLCVLTVDITWGIGHVRVGKTSSVILVEPLKGHLSAVALTSLQPPSSRLMHELRGTHASLKAYTLICKHKHMSDDELPHLSSADKKYGSSTFCTVDGTVTTVCRLCQAKDDTQLSLCHLDDTQMSHVGTEVG